MLSSQNGLQNKHGQTINILDTFFILKIISLLYKNTFLTMIGNLSTENILANGWRVSAYLVFMNKIFHTISTYRKETLMLNSLTTYQEC